MKKDFSKEIFEKYFNKERLLEITLNDGTVLEGYLVGFSHGDQGDSGPYIVRWHFVGKHEIKQYRELFSVDSEEPGRSIEQKDIKSVTFK